MELLFSILLAHNLITKDAELPPSSVFCSCVKTARLFDADVPKADAIDIQPNYWQAEEGDFVLLKYGEGVEKNHIAYEAVVTSKRIKLYEGNFDECQFTTRWISKDDPTIRGFYKADPQIAYSGI